jgi:hypothetical protein
LAIISFKILEMVPKSPSPIIPPRVKAERDRKNKRYPRDTLTPDRNIFNLKNKNPKNIKTKGKRKAVLPKYLFSKSLIRIKELPFLEKDKRRIMPKTINPNAKIE